MTRTLLLGRHRRFVGATAPRRKNVSRNDSAWTLARTAGSLWLVLLAGCYSGPLGPRTSYTSAPPAQTGSPANRPPIANQPVLTPAGSASSVKVVPFAAISKHAMVQVQNGSPLGNGVPVRGGTRPLAMLAANERMIDGRSLPMLDRPTRLPESGGATLRKNAARAMEFAPSSSARVVDLPSTPQEDLKYHGGRTIRDLTFINLYIGGQDSWDPQDWRNIDKALAASMSDPHLNNVIVQYFGNQPIKNTFKGSYFLSGWRPQFVAKGDFDRQVRSLHASGAFNGLDLPNTVVNFMLPRGTVLGDPNGGQEVALQSKAIPHEEAEDSTGGLGGYHGSVQIGATTIYYATGVYSERLPNGKTNGIPVFDQNWKNIVATFYHELQEARTDPDVDDAIRSGEQYLGWTSSSGLEIGDYPIAEARQLKQVFVEVPLADGSGLVPVQLQYSNAVHGPEGPIPYPHGMEPPPGTQPPVTNPPANNGQPGNTKPPANNPPSTPITNDPELAKVIAQWNQLEDFVKKAIVRLAGSR